MAFCPPPGHESGEAVTYDEARAYYDAHPEFPRPLWAGHPPPPAAAPQPASARRGTPKDETPESEVEAGITALLREDGWRALKTDPVSDKGRGKGFGEFGMADYLYIRYVYPLHSMRRWSAEVLWVEHKRPHGSRIAQNQLDWHKIERDRGALTLIAGVDFEPTVSGFRDWYSKSGLRRET